MKLGDAVATFAQPIARGVDHLFGTDIEHCQGCQQRKEFLNNFSLFDLLTRSKQQTTTNGEHNMPDEQQTIDWQLVVIVNAADIQGAIAGLAGGKVMSVNPRPQLQTGPGGRISPQGQTIIRSTPVQ